MIRVAILSFSDGRNRVHQSLKAYISQQQDLIAQALGSTNEVQVVFPDSICSSNKDAVRAAKWILGKDVDACILNVSVFSFPNYAGIAARILKDIPKIAISPINGALPGLGGLQAAVSAIRQQGGECEKLWGNVSDPKILSQLMSFLRGAHAARRLVGQVFGLYGGRSIGIVSGTVSPDIWMKLFGVDIDHVDEAEIVRRAQMVPNEKTDHAIGWLEKHLGNIQYEQDKLTKEALALQVNCYIALKDLIAERGHDFVGVKCHYEMSEYFVTQCISAAFLNDPYDWDGIKEPVVLSCEADADAGLTMQVLKLVSGKPVLFMDLRHYMQEEDLFALCNCGAMSTWYAADGNSIEHNLAKVSLCPVIPKYAGKGAHVQYIAAPKHMTFARLTHQMDAYTLQAFEGDFHQVPLRMLERTSPAWPHAFTKTECDPMTVIEKFESNHVHAVAGSYLEELSAFARIKNIKFEAL